MTGITGFSLIFLISDISGGLLCGTGSIKKKGDVRVPLIYGGGGGLGHDPPENFEI